jgi:hypothetical protein
MKDNDIFLFPRPLPTGKFPPNECVRIIGEYSGATLRDWMAGQALAAIAHANGLEDLAMRAYALADAMIAERAKGSS